MNEEGGKGKKKGAKKGIDILTILGLLLGLGLIWFGISFSVEPAAPTEEGFTDALGTFDEAGFNDAVTAFELEYATWEAAGGMFNMGQFSNAFIDVPSIAITIGGTFAGLMVAYPLNIFAKLPTYILIAIMPSKFDPSEYIEQIVEFAKEARVKGLLSLEDKLAEANDEFLRSSLMLVVDSVEPEKVHELLQAELGKLDERHGIGKLFMDSGAAFAPGFGMIGTLIGLINMLGNLSDPNSIGPAMAVALLTTLYGSFLANLIFTPIGNKLGIRHNEEYLCRELITVGVEAIQAGENPKFIEEKLNLLVVTKKKKGKKDAKAEG